MLYTCTHMATVGVKGLKVGYTSWHSFLVSAVSYSCCHVYTPRRCLMTSSTPVGWRLSARRRSMTSPVTWPWRHAGWVTSSAELAACRPRHISSSVTTRSTSLR